MLAYRALKHSSHDFRSCSHPPALPQLVANEQDGLVYIIDLKSAHGTHVEGEKLIPNRPCALQTGQEVRFGAHDGGARYKVTCAPSRKRPAEDRGGEDEQAAKRKTSKGKVCPPPGPIEMMRFCAGLSSGRTVLCRASRVWCMLLHT